jgi:hypothetical protein
MRLVYQPRSSEQSKKAEIAVVLVTASGLTVLDSKRAKEPATWTVSGRTSVVGVVYGPQGLDEKKVGKLVRQDSELIEQLAQFAERTTQTEAVIEALLSPGSPQTFDSALLGVSGISAAKLEKKPTADQQALALMHALTPTLSAYDPLASEPKRVQQSMSAAASIAGMFLGSGVGLAAGGAAVLVNLRTLMFPGTDFHSSFAQPAGYDSLTLCAKRPAEKPRTRQAYLWAVRLPDVPAPAAKLEAAAHVPAGVKSLVKLESADLSRLARVQQWLLGDKPVPARVVPESNSVEFDLTKFAGEPGEYMLTGKWDWDTIDAAGKVNVHALPDLKSARVKPESQDRLVTASGAVPVDLEGADLEFVEKLAFRRLDDRSGKVTDLYFKLPGGKRGGPQPVLETEIDMKTLLPGEYAMMVTQSGGKTQEVPFRVLPPEPKLSNLPLRVNLSDKAQVVSLEGSGLERIEKLECQQAEISLDGKTASFKLKPGAKRGDRFDLLVRVQGVSQPMRLKDGVEVVGRRPRIVQAKTSFPPGLGVALREGELPAGSMASLSVELAESAAQPGIALRCRGEAEKRMEARPVGDRALFLSFDPASVGAPGCVVEALVVGKSEGRSESRSLGRVIRVPVIDGFRLTDEKAGDGLYTGILTGTDLETIAKTGWDEKQGVDISGIPVITGEKQTLKVALPWPSPAPHAPIYIWLRGEAEGRATEARY